MKFSLRNIFGASLLILALVPAGLVVLIMSQGGESSVNKLAGEILANVATRIQSETEQHLRQAHLGLNGLVSERMTPSETEAANRIVTTPTEFRTMALALTRQSPDISRMFLIDAAGKYYEVGERNARPESDLASAPITSRSGIDSILASASQVKARAFSNIEILPETRQLQVTLTQPVYAPNGSLTGVFGIDIYLQRLADLLRTQRISSHGAAYVVDEDGFLVASSAGDALIKSGANGRFERTTPAQSVNPVIRASFAAIAARNAQRSADTVANDLRLQSIDGENGAQLIAVQYPFGQEIGLRWSLAVAAPESDFTEGIALAWRTSIAVIIALAILASIAAFVIAQVLGRRLGRLSVAAKDLGRGKIPFLDKTTRIAEVAELSQVIHDSAQQLYKYREQVTSDAIALQDANETLEQRVAGRTSELLASREEALGAARAKAAFLATMSHEIRTPLNGVVGMTTLLAETLLDEEQRDYLQTVRVSSDQLLAVINDILDFSKIESGKLDLENEPLGLRAAIEEACDIAAPRAREKGLELIIDIPDSKEGEVPTAISGDVTRLRQVLINLITNAVKFTERGEIDISVRLLDETPEHIAELEFRVTDSGIGIPPSRVGALFEAFTQVDASTTRKYGGSGLGLAICKRLVELMGGRIGVESVLGKGSTFWFTIKAPIAQIAPRFGPAEAGALRGKRVLIVDDHATNIRILARQLQLWEMTVVSAESGAIAITSMESLGDGTQAGPLPDVIITDMHMPEMDGLSLARRFKANGQWQGIPLILLSSGFMPASDDSHALFDARLLKPARQSQLFDTIARVLSPAQKSVAKPQKSVDNRKNILILVADDNAVNLKVASAMLSKLGYDVQTVVDGKEAVEAVARAHSTSQKFGAILMDLNMPDVDGLQATAQIQAAWGKNAPPIIALTAAASAEDRIRCEAAGMQDYLTKPLQVGSLANTLERWVSPPVAPGTVGEPTAKPSSLEERATESQDTTKLIDFSRLEEFREFDDDELSMTREVARLFMDDVPKRLEALRLATTSGDAVALSRAAHALKGSASNVGAVAIYEIAAAMEADAGQGVPLDVEDRINALNASWSSTQIALIEWLK